MICWLLMIVWSPLILRWSCFDNGDNNNLQPSWGMAGVESSWRFGKKYSSSYFRHLCPCQLVSLASKTHDNCFLLKLFPSRSARTTNMSICNHTKNANFRPGQFHQDLPDQQICQYVIIQKMQTSAQVNFIKICQTNKVLVTASLDGSFCLWDIKQVKTGVSW